MSRAALKSQIHKKASEKSLPRKCPSGGKPCPLQKGKEEQHPVIEDTKPIMRDPRKHPSKLTVSLPKSTSEVPKQSLDAGEPHGCNFSLCSEELDFCKHACDSLKPFQMLSAPSSEELLRSFDFHEGQTLDKISTRSRIFDSLMELRSAEKEDESHALKRWQYWLNDKKIVQNRLSKRLGRPVPDLLMQDCDKYREVMEKKLMLWYSRIPEPDKWRGSPARWKPQLRIRNKKNLAQYCLIKSKLENEERPELEFIGIPNPIKKEKGLLTADSLQEGKGKGKNEGERKVHCKEERNCDSHEIEMDELAIIGVQIADNTVHGEQTIQPKDMPEIIEPELPGAELPPEYDIRISVFSLVIGDEEIKYEIGSEDCQDPDRMFVWNVDFGMNMVGSTAEKVLRVENRGTMAVRYDWLLLKYEKKNPFSELQPKRYDPCFFFDKNSGFFLPGQIYNLKFYFQAKASGIRKENWRLKTTPPLSERMGFATICLSGVATEDYSFETAALEFYLHRRALEANIRAIINTILHKVFNPCEQLSDIEYRSLFNERQLFEYHNPKHFYHSSIVTELKRVFEEIPGKTQTEWDLSLHSLWNLIKSYKTGKEQSDSFRKVIEMSKQLFRPNYLPVRDTTQYRMSYGILCKMANLMEDDYNTLRDLVAEKVELWTDRWGELGEAKESTRSFISMPGEMGETDGGTLLRIRPINFMFFHTLWYLKAYSRVCEAVEHIAGVIETRKVFKPWKKVNYKPPKPPRIAKPSDVQLQQKFCQLARTQSPK